MSSSEQAFLTEYLDSRRVWVEQGLERYLPKPPRCPAIVADAMRYSVLAGGKRLRPLLTIAAAEAVTDGAPSDQIRELALPSACAIEFIHTYSLIHDDLPAMDDDTLRRGRPTLHVVHGEGIAILAGDGLLAEAFALLARDPSGDDDLLAARKLRVIQRIADAASGSGMVGGQAIDLQAASTKAPLDGPALHEMHSRKTGALIRAATCAGAIIMGASETSIEALDRYAKHLGLAFQIVDDILDVEGAAATLGKTAGKDAASGKPTYPALYGVEASRKLAAESIDRARQALSASGLAYRPLVDIAGWIGSRTN